jgi:hypothetical protein
MKRSAAKQPVKPVTPPPGASLLEIAPELRNTIYHRVAQDIDEASIIGRKIGFASAGAQDRFWDTIAKHPLSQTCRQLRQEFDPIHRHRTMTTGVSRYYLDLENFDLDRLGDFARLPKQVPDCIRQHVVSKMKPHNITIRFHLTQYAGRSVQRICDQSQESHRLPTGPEVFTGLLRQHDAG